MQKINQIKYIFCLALISILLFIFLLGPKFINFTNHDWLYFGDLSQYQLGWKYFRNDIWRFPLGLNPNFGIYLNSSIVFTDSIPILAIFFKIFNNYLPIDFQYFSIWILICIYFQLFFSFKIINKLTQNSFFSLLGSLFFCFATIFLHRSAIHLSLMGQWIILSYILNEINNSNYKKIIRNLNILLSVGIHFYFTIIILLFYTFQKIYDLFKKNLDFKETLIEYSTIFMSTILTMYVLGYFTLNLDDGLGWGYGYFNFNLNSFFNPLGLNNNGHFSWSLFLPMQKYQNGEIEGFSYLGLSGIIFLILFILNFFKKKYLIIFDNYKLLTIFLGFVILAVSNNINFGDTNLLSLSLNKMFYLILSSIRASGRLIWPVYYIIFIVGIIFIYRFFDKKKSTLIILFLFFIQIIDLHPGLLQYKFGSQYLYSKNYDLTKDKIWNNISSDFSTIRLIEPRNDSNIYKKLPRILLNEDFKKNDIVYLARINRQTVVSEKYKLINLFRKKNLDIFNNSIFISDNFNFTRNLYQIYSDELHFYFRDNLWLVTSKRINNEIENLELLAKEYELNLENSNTIDFQNSQNLSIGIGWKKQEQNHLILEGFYSSLFFKIKGKKCANNSFINFKISKFYENDNNQYRLKVFINEKENKNIIVSSNKDESYTLNFKCEDKNLFFIDFEVENPVSAFDLKRGLNREKKSIILKSLSINS